jgi:hypothetical protein
MAEHVKKSLQENGIDMLKLQFKELQQQTHWQPVIPPLHSAQRVNCSASTRWNPQTVHPASRITPTPPMLLPLRPRPEGDF